MIVFLSALLAFYLTGCITVAGIIAGAPEHLTDLTDKKVLALHVLLSWFSVGVAIGTLLRD